MSFMSSITGGKLSGLSNSFISNGSDGITEMVNSAISSYLSGTITRSKLESDSSSGDINSSSTKEGAQANIKRVNTKAYAPSKTNISCFIINLLTGTSVTFECEPDDITDSNGTSYAPTDIHGRSSPYQGYSGSGPRTISFTVELHSDLCPQGLQNTINYLKALTYPQYGGGVLQPPVAYFHIGYMISCRCIVNNVDITFQKPIRDHFYIHCQASISLTEVRDGDAPLSTEEVESNGQYTYR